MRAWLGPVPSAREDAGALAQQALSNCWRPDSMKPVIMARLPVARPGKPYSIVLLRAVTDLAGHRVLQADFEAKMR